MALQASDIVDVVNLTLPDLGRLKIVEIAAELQDYVALPSLMRKERVEKSGRKIEWRVMKNHSGAAKNVGLFNVDDLNVADVTAVADIPWRYTTTNYSFDEREEAMQGPAEEIVDLIMVRREDGKLSLTELIEDDFWDKPVNSSDTVQPFGVFYYLVKNSTEGFNGGNPTGFSSGAANIDSSSVSRWANYTNIYTNVSRDDLQAKLRKAIRLTRFKSPTGLPHFDGSDRFVLYVNEATISLMEQLAEEQNDRLGFDMAPGMDRVTVNRMPVNYVPKLDADTTDPIVGLNWGTFKFCVKRGFFLKESPAAKAPRQHNVVEVHIDLAWNLKCLNRRRNFIISK